MQKQTMSLKGTCKNYKNLPFILVNNCYKLRILSLLTAENCLLLQFRPHSQCLFKHAFFLFFMQV